MADREMNHPVRCGYGLLGLCCDSCLCGPCRRNPFDDNTGEESCGADGDCIVANNLLERVLRESLSAMAAFRNGLEQASGPGGLVEAARRGEMNLLLSPLSREPSVLLETIYPERAFPSLHAIGFPTGSWMAELLDAAAGRQPVRREPEAVLADTLRLSALALAAETFSRELDGLGMEADIALPDSPSPLLIIVADEKGSPDDGRESLLKTIEAVCGKAARIHRLPNGASLPTLARAVFAKWGIPLSMTGSTAVVVSSSLTRGLGALALGFSLLALPGYPIGGSARVEGYLTGQMRSNFGHACLSVPPREDPAEAVLRSLAP
jgi:hypothetical protein